MSQAEKPETIDLTCGYCGHSWQQAVASLVNQEIIVYRSGRGDSPRRVRVPCPNPNCPKGVNVTIPKEWIDHD